jgi:hypothetical protein
MLGSFGAENFGKRKGEKKKEKEEWSPQLRWRVYFSSKYETPPSMGD